MAQKKSQRVKNNSSKEEYVLVYSTDPAPVKNCKGCLRPEAECKCADNKLIDTSKLNPVINIEKKGRGGKTVTIISRLPNHQTFLAKLLKDLKKTIGSGGTSYVKNGEGVIEIQGEQQDRIRDFISRYKNS